MARRRRSTEYLNWSKLAPFIVLTPLLIVSIFTFGTFGTFGRIGTSTAFLILGAAALVGVYAFAGIALIRRMTRTRVHKLRVAVTGLPGAGKTVFSVLLFDALMNERIPGMEFNAESKSAISVYQAIRNLPAGVWPKSTARGAVSAYTGAIASRRSRIDLEIGDSAGEHWLELNDKEDRDAGYLEYVLSAQALAHVIPFDSLEGDGVEKQITNDVDDLRLVARLRRQVHGQRASIPLLVVLSKVDLAVPVDLIENPSSGLFKIVSANELSSLELFRRHTDRTFDLLRRFAEQLEREYSQVWFILSSAPVVSRNRLAVGDRGNELVNWIIDAAQSVEAS